MASVRSFSSVLYLLFIPLLFGSVGTTSWLAHHAGQESVEEVASTLGAVYTERVRERVEAYLREPRLVTQVIRTARSRRSPQRRTARGSAAAW